MTASFAPTRPGPSPAVAVVVGVVASIAIVTLMIAGITFVGLAIAFPIALPVAELYHVPVSAADAAIAAQFAPLWWAFAALAFATFGVVALITVKVADVLSPKPRD